MALHQQLFKYITELEVQNTALKKQIQKYLQEIEYVCIKVGVDDWQQFISEIRLGKIAKVSKSIPSFQKRDDFNSFFREKMKNLEENQLSKQIGTKHFQLQFQSPISSERQILHIKGGGDTSRSQIERQTPRIEQSIQLNEPQTSKTKSFSGQTAQDILKLLLNYDDGQKKYNNQTFDTFRANFDQNNVNFYLTDRLIFDQIKSNPQNELHQHTIKRGKKIEYEQDYISNDTLNRSKKFKNQQIQVEFQTNSKQIQTDEYLLAIENTKLRKQIKELEKVILVR